MVQERDKEVISLKEKVVSYILSKLAKCVSLDQSNAQRRDDPCSFCITFRLSKCQKLLTNLF